MNTGTFMALLSLGIAIFFHSPFILGIAAVFAILSVVEAVNDFSSRIEKLVRERRQ